MAREVKRSGSLVHIVGESAMGRIARRAVMQGILVWGGCIVAYLIGGFAGIAWWMILLFVGVFCYAHISIARHLKKDGITAELFWDWLREWEKGS